MERFFDKLIGYVRPVEVAGVDVVYASGHRCTQYGHGGVAGSSPGYLNTPDDAYRLRSGITTVADIQNCRIVQVGRAGQVTRVLGGSCVHDPPHGFASPNGDTPLPDGTPAPF